MSHSFSHMMSAFRPNQQQELRNCYPEIKDVSKAFMSLNKHRADANNAILRWGRAQNAQLANFLTTMCKMESHENAHTEALYEAYRKYYLTWKEFMDDQKELQYAESAASKAHQASRQAEDAAQKEESRNGDVIGARARLAAAHAAEDATMQYLREKNLTVQQTLFRKMREAFYMLYTARMAYLKASAQTAEESLQHIRAFPAVIGVNDDGSLRTSQIGAEPDKIFEYIWPKGEVFYSECLALRPLVEQGRRDADQIQALTRENETFQSAKITLLADHAAQLQELRSVGDHETTHKDDIVAAFCVRAALSDARESLHGDVIDCVLKKALAARNMLSPDLLGSTPLSSVNAAVAIISTVYSAELAFPYVKQDVRDKIEEIIEGIVQNTQELFNRIETDGASNPPAEVVSRLQELLTALCVIAASQQIEAQLPAHVSQNISTAHSAIRDALDQLQQTKAQSRSGEIEPLTDMHQTMLSEGTTLLTSIRKILDAGTSLKETIVQRDKDDHSMSRRWLNALVASVDTIINDVPQWMLRARALSSDQSNTAVEEFQAVTRSLSSCTAQLLAFVRAYRLDGMTDPSIEKSSIELQLASHRIITASEEIYRYRSASQSLETRPAARTPTAQARRSPAPSRGTPAHTGMHLGGSPRSMASSTRLDSYPGTAYGTRASSGSLPFASTSQPRPPVSAGNTPVDGMSTSVAHGTGLQSSHGNLRSLTQPSFGQHGKSSLGASQPSYIGSPTTSALGPASVGAGMTFLGTDSNTGAIGAPSLGADQDASYPMGALGAAHSYLMGTPPSSLDTTPASALDTGSSVPTSTSIGLAPSPLAAGSSPLRNVSSVGTGSSTNALSSRAKTSTFGSGANASTFSTTTRGNIDSYFSNQNQFPSPDEASYGGAQPERFVIVPSAPADAPAGTAQPAIRSFRDFEMGPSTMMDASPLSTPGPMRNISIQEGPLSSSAEPIDSGAAESPAAVAVVDLTNPITIVDATGPTPVIDVIAPVAIVESPGVTVADSYFKASSPLGSRLLSQSPDVVPLGVKNIKNITVVDVQPSDAVGAAPQTESSKHEAKDKTKDADSSKDKDEKKEDLPPIEHEVSHGLGTEDRLQQPEIRGAINVSPVEPISHSLATENVYQQPEIHGAVNVSPVEPISHSLATGNVYKQPDLHGAVLFSSVEPISHSLATDNVFKQPEVHGAFEIQPIPKVSQSLSTPDVVKQPEVHGAFEISPLSRPPQTLGTADVLQQPEVHGAFEQPPMYRTMHSLSTPDKYAQPEIHGVINVQDQHRAVAGLGTPDVRTQPELHGVMQVGDHHRAPLGLGTPDVVQQPEIHGALRDANGIHRKALGLGTPDVIQQPVISGAVQQTGIRRAAPTIGTADVTKQPDIRGAVRSAGGIYRSRPTLATGDTVHQPDVSSSASARPFLTRSKAAPPSSLSRGTFAHARTQPLGGSGTQPLSSTSPSSAMMSPPGKQPSLRHDEFTAAPAPKFDLSGSGDISGTQAFNPTLLNTQAYYPTDDQKAPALHDYGKGGELDSKQNVFSTQAEIMRLEKQLESERARLARLRPDSRPLDSSRFSEQASLSS